MSQNEFYNALVDVIQALGSHLENSPINVDLLKAKEAIENSHPEHFHLYFTSPVSRLTEKAFLSQIKSNHARFLFKQSEFLMRQFKNYFETFEGIACSTDKARFCMRALAYSLVFEKPIIMDRKSTYTFHLPETLDEGELLSFFHALYDLYHARNEAYLKFMLDTSSRISLPKQ